MTLGFCKYYQRFALTKGRQRFVQSVVGGLTGSNLTVASLTTHVIGDLMVHSTDIRVLVDRLLKVPKVPAGEATWVDEHRKGDMRLLYPLVVEGEISDANLMIVAYPRSLILQFRINLLFGRAITRLDFVHDEEHVNSFDRPSELTLGPFKGPHYHSWEDNRRFATKSALPDRLENARILEEKLQTFENTFRWFCGQTNVDISVLGVPSLPATDRFL